MSTITIPTNIAAELRSHTRSVRERLAAVRARARRQLILEGIVWTLGVLFLLAAATLVIDYLFRLERVTRLGFTVLALVAIGWIVYRYLWRPLRVRLEDLDLAEVLDRRSPGVGQRVANVLQLPGLLNGEAHASPAMIRATVARNAAELDSADWNSLFNRDRRQWLMAILASIVLLAAGIWLLWPATAQLWARRWLLGSNVRWPQNTYLSVEGLNESGRMIVPRGESLLLVVSAQPKFESIENGWSVAGRANSLLVEGKAPPTSVVPQQVSIDYESAGGAARQGNFTHYEEGRFRFELPPVSEPTAITIAGGDDWLGPIEIEPVDRPTLSSLTVSALWPGSEKPRTFAADQPEEPLLFLTQTKLDLRIEGSVPLEAVQLTTQPASSLRAERVSDNTFKASWEMQDTLLIEFKLIARDTGLSSKPFFVTIGLLHDREPRVSARATGVGRRVTPQARIPLAIRAVDDFGVTQIATEMQYTIVQDEKPQTKDEQVEKLEPPKEGDEIPSQFDWSYTVAFRDRGFAAGTALKLRATAVDNNPLSRQTGVSRWVNFQIVSPEELFYEILMRQREQRAKFAAALATAKTQAATLESLEDVEEVSGLLRAHQVVARQVSQVAQALDASLEEMTLNELGTPQARDLLSTNVIQPLRGLSEERMVPLRGLLDKLVVDGNISADNRKTAHESQQELVAAMQKILDQMAQWESFVDVVNQLKQVMKLQKQIMDITDELRKKRTDEVFDK